MADNNDYKPGQATELLEEELRLLREQFEQQKRLNTIKNENTDRVLKGMKRLSQLQNQINSSLIDEKGLRQELEAIAESEAKLLASRAAVAAQTRQQMLKDNKSELEIEKAINKLYDDSDNAINQQLSNVQEIRKKREEDLENVKKQNRLTAGGATAVEKTYDKIFSKFSGWGKEDWDNNPLAQLLMAKDGDLKNWLKGAEAALLETLENPQDMLKNIAVGVGKRFLEANEIMLKGLDEQSSAVAALTGRQREYGYILEAAFAGQQRYAMSIEATASAFNTLYTSSLDFTDMSEKTQKSLTRYVAKMEKLNITNIQAGELLDTLNNSFGYLGGTGTKVFDRLVAGAIKLGMAPKAVTEAFNNNRSILARYGDEAVEVFEDILAASKETSIGVDELFSKFSQYDTFEGAAQAAGKLNAVLGGNLLNATELLLANEAERVKMLQESLQISGLQYDLLGKFEKMAIGEALGIQDIDTLNRLFQDSNQQISEREKALDSLGVSQEEINKAMSAATTLTERLEALMSSLTVTLMPLVEAANYVLDAFLYLNEATEGYLFPTLFALIGVAAALAASMGTVVGPIIAIAAGVVFLVKLFSHFRDQAAQLAKALAGLVVPVLITIGVLMGIITLPIVKIIAVIVLLGLVIYELVQNFQKWKKIFLELISGPLERMKEVLGSVSDSSSGFSKVWEGIGFIIDKVVLGIVMQFGYLINILIVVVTYLLKAGAIVWNLFTGIFDAIGAVADGNFKEAFIILFEAIGQAIADLVVAIFTLFYDVFGIIVKPFEMAWDYLFGNTVWGVDEIKEVFINILNTIGDTLSTIGDFLIAPFRYAWDKVSAIWNGDIVGETFSKVANSVKDKISAAKDFVSAPFEDAWDHLFGNTVWSVDEIEEVFTAFLDIIDTVLSGVMDIIFSPFNAVFERIKNAIESFKDVKTESVHKAKIVHENETTGKPPSNPLYRASYEFGRAVGQAVFGPGGEAMPVEAPILSGAQAEMAKRGVTEGAASVGTSQASVTSSGMSAKTLVIQLVMDGETISKKVIKDIDSQFNLKRA